MWKLKDNWKVVFVSFSFWLTEIEYDVFLLLLKYIFFFLDFWHVILYMKVVLESCSADILFLLNHWSINVNTLQSSTDWLYSLEIWILNVSWIQYFCLFYKFYDTEQQYSLWVTVVNLLQFFISLCTLKIFYLINSFTDMCQGIWISVS